MCSLLLASTSGPIIGALFPWSPSDDMVGPFIAAVVFALLVLFFLIGATSVWLASKVVVSDGETTFRKGLAIFFYEFMLGLGMEIVHLLLSFATGAKAGSAGGNVIALFVLFLTVVFGLMIPANIYGIGMLRAFRLNLLSGFFNFFIYGLAVVLVVALAGIGAGTAREKLQATAERVKQTGARITHSAAPTPTTTATPSPLSSTPADLSPNIDSMLEAALHPKGPRPPLAEREAAVRRLQQELQFQRNSLPLNDPNALAAFQNRFNRYMLLLNAVKSERQSQTGGQTTSRSTPTPP